ncbi:AAA family ATPase [Arthrobacter burdickii]|uniref:MoxR family ATPase n=1 Tax=Arthrobacter burdickii TaxID=3035920 RepID=A0ABT8K1Q1_9MICC|nr:MoxR family ATPase [Arthrobacter burdickii]MDN4611127.1 MoxR family ATPase [Arthrobacter burdickii]
MTAPDSTRSTAPTTGATTGPTTGADAGDGPVDTAATLGRAILERTGTVVVGAHEPLRLALAAVLAGGHVLFEDLPGLGKTLAAKTLAQALGLDFRRLQFTPDLLPSDVTGSSIFNPATREFEFRPGPVFAGLFLADEINRTSPKTQSALLEAMAEAQVSAEGTTMPLQRPFHVFATSNPIEFEGTYPLPEAQLDRFLVRLRFGYPGPGGEQDIIARRITRRQDETRVESVTTADGLLHLQAVVESVGVDADVIDYAVRLTGATRTHPAVEVGASPRGSQALVLLGRALAVLDGRPFVLPEDLKEGAVAVLAHRLTLTPSSWAQGIATEAVVREVLAEVPTPPTVPRG